MLLAAFRGGSSALVVLACVAVAHGETVSGKTRVIDGDTLEVQGQMVRLHGIDAAESGQRCVAQGRKFKRPGDDAEAMLSGITAKGVTCEGSKFDDFGRLIATCRTNQGVEVNKALVDAGLAWAFVKFSTDYVAAETSAKASHKGVWSMACQEPWVYRAKRWEVAAQKSPAGCPIKGNISGNGHIYHTPWSRHYTRTKVDTGHGERWFCSEGEALKAGWRPPTR